jgi:molecular chaperone DnaK
MVEEAAKNRTEQMNSAKRWSNYAIHGDQLAYQAEKLIKDLGDKITAEQQTSVESKVKDLREAHPG